MIKAKFAPSMTFEDIVETYIRETPKCRPIGMCLDEHSELMVMHSIFGDQLPGTASGRRKVVENMVKEEKPSGIEILLWDQRATKAFFPIPQ